MPRNVKILTVEEIKSTMELIFVSLTDSVTKISPGSVFSSILSGVASISQKIMKETAIIESYSNPDIASGSSLDVVASHRGINNRLGALGSSVFLRLHATSGTSYDSATVKFTGDHGIVFILEEDIEIGDEGWTYAKVVSESAGFDTNVAAFSIDTIISEPAGHKFLANDVRSSGGRNSETDNQLRWRVKNIINIASVDTKAKLEQLCNQVNNRVFKIYNLGITDSGKHNLGLLTFNGTDLSIAELNNIQSYLRENSSLSDSKIEVSNITPNYIDITCRMSIESSAVIADVRESILVRLLDFLREIFFSSRNEKLPWVDIFNIISRTDGVSYLTEQFFLPNSDIDLYNELPVVLRSMEIRDLDGIIISDATDDDRIMNFYSTDLDFNYQKTFLRELE